MTMDVAYTIDIQGQGAAQFNDQILCNMHSLKRTKRPEDTIVVHVAYSNISAEVMDMMTKLYSDDFRISFVKIGRDLTGFMQSCTRQQPTAAYRAWCGIVYARLFLCELLPTVDRCIYLDSDMLIRKSIHELWTADLGGKKLGMVMGVVPEYGFNSGVIVFDFSGMRKDVGLLQRLREFMRKNAKSFLLPDQTVINRFFAKDICGLPLTYNYPPCPSSLGTDLKTLNDAHIWHFYNQPVKPVRFDDQGRALVVWNAELDLMFEEFKALQYGNEEKGNGSCADTSGADTVRPTAQ